MINPVQPMRMMRTVWT